MEITTTTQVDPAVATFYDRVLLVRALPKLVHDKFAQRRNVPSKSGNTIKFRRFSSLSAATTPLPDDGINPPGQQMSKTDLTATVSWYGDYITITEIVDMTVEDKVLTEAAELLGEQAGLTIDTLLRDILVACASSTNASNGVNGQSPTEIAKEDIDGVVKTMLGNNATMISKVITASTGVGTSPVRPAFFGIMHTDNIDALEDVTGYKNTSEYPRQEPVMEAEWGSTGNVRWLMSSNADRTLDTPDTYKNLIIGENSYAMTEITGSALKNIVHAFGSGGTSDPLNRIATSGWRLSFVARILNDSFIHRLVTTNKAGS
jgi:N4-gp56 family major capsid protein